MDDTESKNDAQEDKNLEDRKKDYSGRAKVREQLEDVYDDVDKGFQDKADQISAIGRFWDIFNCELTDQQAYSGKSQIFVPLVRDAIEARVTRFVGRLFPQTGRYADVTSADGNVPYDIIAMLDHYVEDTNLRDMVIPALIRSGDVTGQYILYLDWLETERHTLKKIQKPLDEYVGANGEAPEGVPKYDDREAEEVNSARPDVVVLDARNLVVLPASVDNIEDAETVAVRLYWTKGEVRKLIRKKLIEKSAGEELLNSWGQTGDVKPGSEDTDKKASEAAGVKLDATKRVEIYQIWTKLDLGGGEFRWTVSHFAGKNLILSCKRNPFWNDRVPVISVPVRKVSGTHFGKSMVDPVEQLQYQANDAVNIGMDSAQYSLLPIIMTDPTKNPRVGSMVMAMMAIWETSPQDTQFVQLPQLWHEGMNIAVMCRDQIMSSLSVNSSMVSGGAPRKPTQAEVAQQQNVALISTDDVVGLLEKGVLSPLLRWFYELDYQYREKEITVRKYGEFGLQADMQQIPPIAVDGHYMFHWFGTDSTKSTQQVQQMIAAINVLRGIPPQMLNGRTLDIGPILEQAALVTFGARLAPKILVDERHKLAVPAIMENELLANNFPVHISPLDNDVEHIQTHQAMLPQDFTGMVRQHIMAHLMQAQAKAMQASGQAPGGSPGVPGGSSPGVPGTPRIGATPDQTRPMQNPPGAIGTDQSPLDMPRKAE